MKRNAILATLILIIFVFILSGIVHNNTSTADINGVNNIQSSNQTKANNSSASDTITITWTTSSTPDK